jgi:signal transduction histidine kinase
VIPRSLTKRIFLAFAALGFAMLVTVGASLFVVLRDTHQQQIRQSLGDRAVAFEASLVRTPVLTQSGIDQRVQDYATSVVADGGFVLIKDPKGGLRLLAGAPTSLIWPTVAPNNVKNQMGTYALSDGSKYIFILPNAGGTNGVKLLFAVPDTSTRQALDDILRTMLIVAVVLLLVGLPIAWLLARSVTGPMRRLAHAAADLPTSSVEKPVPLEGPTEVRVLTEHFNAMAHELASTRHEETQMLANLRHDLRTPLTSIGGYAEAIADGTASGKRAEAAARTIAEEAQRLERLVGELGVVERLRDGPAALRPEALDATALITAAAARFEGRAASQGVTLEATGSGRGEPTLAFTGDRLAAERILQNLVDNALSVLPKGGHVWLRAAALALPGRVPGISMSVTDDGPGFPPGTTEKVFERFYRADPSRAGSGSGLGLAIVRELARAHGGEAWSENVAPHGARVTVMLPLVPVMAANKAADPKTE